MRNCVRGNSCVIFQPCELVAIVLMALPAARAAEIRMSFVVESRASFPETVLEAAHRHFCEVLVDRPVTQLGVAL